MQNVTMDVQGDVLIIKVNLKERFGKSASGKTTVIASTRGAAALPGGEQVSLNVYTKE